jgi:hypothetical protein
MQKKIFFDIYGIFFAICFSNLLLYNINNKKIKRK